MNSKPETIEFKYVQSEPDASGNRVAKVTLTRALPIDGGLHKEVLLRECDLGVLIDAREEAPTNDVHYKAATIARQIVQIGTFKGPFTTGMLRGLRQLDYLRLIDAVAELDLAGELKQ